MSVSEWDNEYARLARAASQMRTQGMRSDSQTQQALQSGLARLDGDLDALPLTAPEITRRRRLIQHLQQPQNTVMESALRQQDDMIDELAVGVGRLKNQTQMISEETRMHVGLLGDVEDNVDLAQTGLEGETRRAAQVKANQSVWRLYMIIVGLSILLVLLILMGLS